MNALRSGKYFSFLKIFFFGCFILMIFSLLVNSANIIKKDHADEIVLNTNSSSSGKDASIQLPYFPKIYSGVGIEHMNINLVNLKLTGLKTGDEIGVFDGKYCVGSMVITENHMLENGINIPSSANDSLITSPNGFIEGHKITLKVYRTGMVYLLYFQTVNNSKDIFESRGSMFALVDFSKSTGNMTLSNLGKATIFPNPFFTSLNIKIHVSHKEKIKIEIIDLNGKVIRSLHEGMVDREWQTVWDGKDTGQHQVSPGIYICRINQANYRIIYQGKSLK